MSPVSTASLRNATLTFPAYSASHSQRLRSAFPCWYCPQITSWSPQGTRVLRQCKVPRAAVIFITIQRENVRYSKKQINKAVTMRNCPMFAVRLWITTSLYHWPTGSLPSTCMVCTPPIAMTFTPRMDQLVICGQYAVADKKITLSDSKGQHLGSLWNIRILTFLLRTWKYICFQVALRLLLSNTGPVRFKVLTAVKISWDIQLCSLAETERSFTGA
jgi:hypothetical protein